MLLLVTAFLLQLAGTVDGRVIDGKTGEPVVRAQVVLSESRRNTSTDETGRFEFQGVNPESITIYVNAAGYALARKTVKSGGPMKDLEIVLVPEGAAASEEITVTTKPFEAEEASAASEQTLSKSEMQSASMVLVGDALRAGQSMPGVVANNDLRTDFSIRGAGFERIGVYVDGILTDNFVHSFVGADSNDRVSLSLIDQDTVEALSILPGAFPAKYGDSAAAITVVETREGNRVRPSGRFGTGLIATSGVVDGPFAHNRGAWLFSARTSYVDYIERLVQRATGTSEQHSDSLDFADANIKLTYDFSPLHKIGLSGIAGTFGGHEGEANRIANQNNPDSIDKFRSRNSLMNAYWRYTPSANFVSNVRGFVLKSKYHIRNSSDLTLDDKDRTQFGIRSDMALQARQQHRIEFGIYGRRLQARKASNTYRSPLMRVLEDYKQRGEEDSYYVQENWNKEGLPVSLSGGGRIEHSNVTHQAFFSPRGAVALNLGRRFTIRAGGGVYRQFPDFDEMFGFFGNPRLVAEKAIHFNLRLERELNARTRLIAETYTREDRGLAFSLAEPRVDSAGNVTTFPNPYANLLDGYGRGVEITLQRRTANGFAGWISYAYSRTWLKDSRDGIAFVSDVDQRHTLNMSVARRIKRTINVSSQFRYGSGQPILGFLQYDSSHRIILSRERNQIRLGNYVRLDLRASKSFLRGRWKWTLSGEVLNVLNHRNLYNVNSDIVRFRSTGLYAISLEKSFGILPAAGFHVEF